jgi:hypothetical protein
MTKAEKQAVYGEKLRVAQARVEMLSAKAKRIQEKLAATLKAIDVCKAKLAEGDDAQKSMEKAT